MSEIKSMKDLPEWASEKYTKTLSACKDDATAIVPIIKEIDRLDDNMASHKVIFGQVSRECNLLGMEVGGYRISNGTRREKSPVWREYASEEQQSVCRAHYIIRADREWAEKITLDMMEAVLQEEFGMSVPAEWVQVREIAPFANPIKARKVA